MYYNVLYNGAYGSLNISYEGSVILQQHFPELLTVDDSFKKYGWTECPRDNQEVIDFMLKTGLEQFSGEYNRVKVHQCPIYEGQRVPYLVDEWYDKEHIVMSVNYKEIARDLAMGESKNPFTTIIRTKGFDVVEAELHALVFQLNDNV